MATSLQVNDILALRAWSSCSNQAAVNTYNLECISIVGGAVTDQDVVDAYEILMGIFYKTFMATSAFWNGVQGYFIRRTGPLPAAVSSIASSGSGTSGPDTVPRNTAAILKYNTPFRGPAQRGRVYLPFVATVNLTVLGEPLAAFNTLMNGFGTTMQTPTVITSGGSSATMAWGIVHRKPKPTPPDFSQIVEAKSAEAFGQMHKRGDYGRANQSPI